MVELLVLVMGSDGTEKEEDGKESTRTEEAEENETVHIVDIEILEN